MQAPTRQDLAEEIQWRRDRETAFYNEVRRIKDNRDREDVIEGVKVILRQLRMDRPDQDRLVLHAEYIRLDRRGTVEMRGYTHGRGFKYDPPAFITNRPLIWPSID